MLRRAPALGEMDPEDLPIGPLGTTPPIAVYRLSLSDATIDDMVRIYRRNDRLTEKNPEPVLIGETTIEDNGDCVSLVECETDLECVGTDPEERNVYQCYNTSICEGQFCLWDNEFQWIEDNID